MAMPNPSWKPAPYKSKVWTPQTGLVVVYSREEEEMLINGHVTREVLARRGGQAILGQPLTSWQFSQATIDAMRNENSFGCSITDTHFCGDPYTIVNKPGIFFAITS